MCNVEVSFTPLTTGLKFFNYILRRDECKGDRDESHWHHDMEDWTERLATGTERCRGPASIDGNQPRG